MTFDFEQQLERRSSDSAKWQFYPADVLPMWVADMDFRSPEPVIQALQERAAHGVFGYCRAPARLSELICERMERLYNWQIAPEHILFLPGLVVAINVLCRALGEPGDEVLTLTPAYPPFLSAPPAQQRVCTTHTMTYDAAEGNVLRYGLDLDGFAAALTPRTRMFLLSHPYNPLGLEFDRPTLMQLAERCIANGTVICSDEIHCDLMLGGARHRPLAALAPEIADQTVTLMAPSKTFNLPGLGCGFAIVPNPELRQAIQKASYGIVPYVNAFAYAGATAAYEHGQPWLTALLDYLTANRDAYAAYMAAHMPQLRTTIPDATYLSWIDCRSAEITGKPYDFFLNEAKVALSDGATFGPGGEGFVRMNLACPRDQLIKALDRMRTALAR